MFFIVAMARRSHVSGAQIYILIAVPVFVNGFFAILKPVSDFDAIRIHFIFSIRSKVDERVLVEADSMRDRRFVGLFSRLRITVH